MFLKRKFFSLHGSSYSRDFLLTNVVVALEYAIEALVELSDATGVEYIEDTIGAPRDGSNDLTKCMLILVYSFDEHSH